MGRKVFGLCVTTVLHVAFALVAWRLQTATQRAAQTHPFLQASAAPQTRPPVGVCVCVCVCVSVSVCVCVCLCVCVSVCLYLSFCLAQPLDLSPCAAACRERPADTRQPAGRCRWTGISSSQPVRLSRPLRFGISPPTLARLASYAGCARTCDKYKQQPLIHPCERTSASFSPTTNTQAAGDIPWDIGAQHDIACCCHHVLEHAVGENRAFVCDLQQTPQGWHTV